MGGRRLRRQGQRPAVRTHGRAGLYVEIARTWKCGDAVAVSAAEDACGSSRLPDNPQRAALLWGPLVLAGDLGPEPERTPEGPRRAAPEDADAGHGSAPGDWLVPVSGRPGTFRTRGIARQPSSAQPDAPAPDVELAPFHQLRRRTYAAYWDVLTTAEYTARVTETAIERDRLRTLEAATIAFVPAGEAEAEKPFNMRGEDTSTVRADGRPGRRAAKWFSFDLRVAPSVPAALVVTYNSDNRRPRTFEISVDGRRLARGVASAEQRLEVLRRRVQAAGGARGRQVLHHRALPGDRRQRRGHRLRTSQHPDEGLGSPWTSISSTAPTSCSGTTTPLPSAQDRDGREVGAVRGVLTSLLGMITSGGATHIGVATDHVIESFRNGFGPATRPSAGVERALLSSSRCSKRS